MKFLCLHGAYGNAEKFRVQLGPFINEVEEAGSAQFKWIDGGFAASPPDGFEDYFGEAPYRRFINFDGVSALDNMMDKIRDFPEGVSPEDAIRQLTQGSEFGSAQGIQDSMQNLIDIIDADPEIDGILGYSEGATTAATLVLEERRRWEEEGRERRLKCAVFFSGWPPMKIVDGKSKCLLADECDDVIDIPTCHIVGCKDPYIHGAMALYSMCDDDTALLFDHGKGHTLPRDAVTLKELAVSMRDSIEKASVIPVMPALVV